MTDIERRRLLRCSLIATGAGFFGHSIWPRNALSKESTSAVLPREFHTPLMAFPEKKALLMHSDMPPLLETPREHFNSAVTANEQFFVRWHHAVIPDSIELSRYRIRVSGHLDNPLSIGIDELKHGFEAVELFAVKQCGGNGRKNYSPMTGGIQWGYGAMGCARWKGARLKEILTKAKLRPGSQFVKVNGLERPVLPDTPAFIRKLDMDECLREDVIVAYEMNGAPIPLLNGYPAVLIVPGYFADHWVKMIETIEVLEKDEPIFYTDKAYRLPANSSGTVPPGEPLPPETRALKTLKIKSVIATPHENATIRIGSEVTMEGVAFDGGAGIKEVLVSIDGGANWTSAKLDSELGKYAFRRWSFAFEPQKTGTFQLMSRAISRTNETQPLPQNMGWNPGGYQWNAVDSLTIHVL